MNDVGDVELTNYFSIALNYKRQPLAVIHVSNQAAHHATNVERIWANRICCFPGPQPFSVAKNQAFELLGITHANDSQANIAVSENKRHSHDGKISRMDAIEITKAKNELRRDLKLRRAAMPYDPEIAGELCVHLAELCVATAAKRVACYLPYGDEPDTELFIDWAIDNEIEVLLPVSNHDGTLHWVIFEGETAEGIFGFAEPVGTTVEPKAIDLAFIPALAVDQGGQRLGKGKGYYDRALAYFDPKPPVIAVIFDDELLEAIPTEEHDHPVDAVITPRGIAHFTQALK